MNARVIINSLVARLTYVGLMLAIVAILSFAEMAEQVDRARLRMEMLPRSVLLLGILSGTCAMWSTLCLGWACASWLRDKRRSTKARKSGSSRGLVPAKPDSPYEAHYSASDKLLACMLSVTFLCLILMAGSLSRPGALAGMVVLFSWTAYNAWRTIRTRIIFTRDGITARVWGRMTSHQYADVKDITVRWDVLSVHFSDGTQLKLHPDLGDVEIMIEFLEKYAVRARDTGHAS